MQLQICYNSLVSGPVPPFNNLVVKLSPKEAVADPIPKYLLFGWYCSPVQLPPSPSYWCMFHNGKGYKTGCGL